MWPIWWNHFLTLKTFFASNIILGDDITCQERMRGASVTQREVIKRKMAADGGGIRMKEGTRTTQKRFNPVGREAYI